MSFHILYYQKLEIYFIQLELFCADIRVSDSILKKNLQFLQI